MDRTDVRGLVNAMFEEIALVLGGVVSLHPVNNEAIWSLVRGLDRVRQRHLRAVDRSDPDPPFARGDGAEITPHPAVEQFLKNLHADTGT